MILWNETSMKLMIIPFVLFTTQKRLQQVMCKEIIQLGPRKHHCIRQYVVAILLILAAV